MNLFCRWDVFLAVAVFLVVGSLSQPAFAKQEKRIEKTFAVSPGGQLSLESNIGSLEILPGKSDTVTITVILMTNQSNEKKIESEFERLHLEFSNDNNKVIVSGDYDWGNRIWNLNNEQQLQVRFVITVPPQFNVDAQLEGGDASISDLEGKMYIKTSGGDLHFSGMTGSIRGHTSGGDIHLEGCRVEADLKTSGGDINVNDVQGSLTVITSGGDIEIAGTIGSLDAVTSGGDIEARFTGQLQTDAELKTSGGDIDVYLDKSISVDVDAVTNGGDIDTDYPVPDKDELSEGVMKAKINEGGPELRLRTSGGDIGVHKL